MMDRKGGAVLADEEIRTVRLDEISRILRLYSTALAGRPVGVKRTAEAPATLVRKGHHLPLTDGKNIYLPDQLDNRVSSEENFEEYKVLAAHQAGYIEFGTFDLDLDALLDHPAFDLLPRPAGEPMSGDLASHYELFFRLFEDRELARDIFFALEDGRVDFRLRHKYRGLAKELRKVATASLEGRPDPARLPLREALVESLVRLSVTGQVEEIVPYILQPAYREICATLARLLTRYATVTDSALAAVKIYQLVGGFPNVPPELVQPGDDEAPYHRPAPVRYRGQTRPELVQLEMAFEMMQDAAGSEDEGIPLTKELLDELIRRGAKIKMELVDSRELAETSGLFVTDLDGVLQEKLKRLTPEERRKLAKLLRHAQAVSEEPAERVFLYDEWDYLIGDYRSHWCRLREIPLGGDSSEIVARIRKERSALISAVQRHFRRIRPEMLKKVKRLRSGEEIELDAAIEAAVDRRAGLTPSERIYRKRERRARDVATAFLIDLSASTDEWVAEEPPQEGPPMSPTRQRLLNIFAQTERGIASEFAPREAAPLEGAKRVIDIEREALVIMAEALQGLGDEYAVYGFSGYGRDNVEFYPIKEFSERYSERVRRRIDAIKPRKSTRMGPAIRHTLEKLAATGRRLKVLILLSDGYPQDFDYGPDRSSRDYGLHDTMVALQEARRMNVHTFCITVDQAGNDYLREMCGGKNYLVVTKPSALPRILPRVYRGLTV